MFMLLEIALRTYQVTGSFQPPISLGFLCHINTLIVTNELLVWSTDIALQEILTEMYVDQCLCIREWWWTRHEKGCMWCWVVPFAPWVGARYNWVFPVIVLGQGTITLLICGMEINVHMCMPHGAQTTYPHWERVWRACVSFDLESQAKPQGSPCTQCVCVIWDYVLGNQGGLGVCQEQDRLLWIPGDQVMGEVYSIAGCYALWGGRTLRT